MTLRVVSDSGIDIDCGATDEIRASADPQGSDYTAIEADGTIEFNGDATVWDDLRVPLQRGRVAGGNNPDFIQFATDGAASNGVYVYSFDDGEEIFFSVQMPHGWKVGSTIYPHLHWSPSSDVDPADNVGIYLEYVWADIGEDFGNTTIIGQDVSTGVNNDKNHLIHNFDDAGISGAGHTLSSILHCRFYRAAAVGDNYADPIWAHEVDFHYEIDTVGSRQVTTK